MAMLRPRRWLGALGVIALALIGTIAGTNLIFLGNLRESTLQTAEADLARHSLTLAENAGQSFQSVDLVLSSIDDYLARKGVDRWRVLPAHDLGPGDPSSAEGEDRRPASDRGRNADRRRWRAA